MILVSVVERAIFVLKTAEATSIVRPGIVVVAAVVVSVRAPRGIPGVPILPPEAKVIPAAPELIVRFCPSALVPMIVLEKLTGPLVELRVNDPTKLTDPVKPTAPVVKKLIGEGGVAVAPRVIVFPVTARLVRGVTPPMSFERVTGFAPALSPKAKPPLIVLAKVKPDAFVVVIIEAPIRVIGCVIVTVADEMLLPITTLFAVETVRASSEPLTPPPMTSPKVTVPVPATRVKSSGVALLLSIVLLKVISAPVVPLVMVLPPNRATGQAKKTGLLLVLTVMPLAFPKLAILPVTVKLPTGVVEPMFPVKFTCPVPPAKVKT